MTSRASLRNNGWGERPWSQDELDAAADLWCSNDVHSEAFTLTGAELRGWFQPELPSQLDELIEGDPGPEPQPSQADPGQGRSVAVPVEGAAWQGDREEGVEYTSRQCSGCGRFYVWPKGSRRPHGKCPVCQPELPL